MRTLIVTAFVSADGVMEDPQWTFEAVEFDEAAYEIKDREQKEATALLLGRRTYEEFAATWPLAGDDDPIGAKLNRMPKYVASRTLGTVSWEGGPVAGRRQRGHGPRRGASPARRTRSGSPPPPPRG